MTANDSDISTYRRDSTATATVSTSLEAVASTRRQHCGHTLMSSATRTGCSTADMCFWCTIKSKSRHSCSVSWPRSM